MKMTLRRRTRTISRGLMPLGLLLKNLIIVPLKAVLDSLVDSKSPKTST